MTADQIVQDIREMPAGKEGIISYIYNSPMGGRNPAISVAFRNARKLGLIQEYCKGGAGNPIYRRTEVK